MGDRSHHLPDNSSIVLLHCVLVLLLLRLIVVCILFPTIVLPHMCLSMDGYTKKPDVVCCMQHWPVPHGMLLTTLTPNQLICISMSNSAYIVG